MIKVEDDRCTIKGSKDDVIFELQIAALFILKDLNTVDKLVLLYSISDMINKSIKGEIIDE